MLFIIDGPDHKGKKFLCDKLSELLNLEVINPNETKAIKNKDYYLNLLEQKQPVIYDTFHLYEVVHSRLRNRTSGVGDSDCKEIEQKIIDLDISSLFITNKHKQLILNKNQDPSNLLSDYELLLSAKAYEMLHEKHKYSTKIELCPNLWR